MTRSDERLIVFENFEKWYGSIQAVKPLNLAIKAGETFAMLGPNGSGKSTIIRSLARLHFPTRGRILVKGNDISKASREYNALFSFMPQRISIPGYLTAREVVTLFAKLRGTTLSRVDEILEMVELHDDADRLVREFSGGMVQRIGLAVTFVSEAEIYLLDEPTLNLDPLGVKRLRELITRLREKGKTFVFASHILEDALQLADRIGILVNGVMVGVSTREDFKAAIAEETSVRVTLARPVDGIASVMDKAGARLVSGNSTSFSFKATPDKRLSVIRAVEAAGGIVEEIHTDPPSWETLLTEHYEMKGNGS